MTRPAGRDGGGPVGLGCGLLLGLVLGALWVLLDGFPPAILVVAAAVFGALAYRYGDRFWNWLAEHWWIPWF
jgi:hypothetical protein